jgi:hypothetical protein
MGRRQQKDNRCGRWKREVGRLDQPIVLYRAHVVHRFGAAFMFDTGTSTGDIAGHSKVSNVIMTGPLLTNIIVVY